MAVKKVTGSGSAATSGTKDKAKKAGRVEFNIKTSVDTDGKDIVNADGELTGIPANFDWETHKPLTKSNFADTALYLDYRCDALQHRITKLTAIRTDLVKKVTHLRQFGDEDVRKLAMKATRMVDQLSALKKELQAEGVDLEALFADSDEVSEAEATE